MSTVVGMSVLEPDSEVLPLLLSTNSLAKVVSDGLCTGCGMCSVPVDGKDSPVAMKFDKERGHFAPETEYTRDAVSCVCPGATMDMPKVARQVHGSEPEDPVLGNYTSTRAAYASDQKLRERAASGGVIPALLRHLFETREIDAVYCAIPGNHPAGASGRIIRDVSELEDISGSIYHPVNFGSALSELLSSGGKFAFVGLPCEIAGLEMLKAHLPHLESRHALSIGLFCGGINTFDGVGYYLRSFGISPKNVEEIEYRYGRWPGNIRVKLAEPRKSERVLPRIRGNSRWGILRYVIAFQGYWMLKRCRICPDQVADFADISVGDPHLEKFRGREDPGVSAVVARTQRGESLIQEALKAGVLADEPLSRDEVVASQGYTLDNRRHVAAYEYVAKQIGLESPTIRTYKKLSETLSMRHYIYAWVDLMKIKLPKHPIVTWFFLPWQIFEYLFITFAPSLVIRRITKLIRNR